MPESPDLRYCKGMFTNGAEGELQRNTSSSRIPLAAATGQTRVSLQFNRADLSPDDPRQRTGISNNGRTWIYDPAQASTETAVLKIKQADGTYEIWQLGKLESITGATNQNKQPLVNITANA